MSDKKLNPHQGVEPRVFREADAGAYTGTSSSWLRNTRCRDLQRLRDGEPMIGPRWTKFGRSVRYYKEDLDCWLDTFRTADADEWVRTILAEAEETESRI